MNLLKLLLLVSCITCAPTPNDLDLVHKPHSQQKSYVELPQPIKSQKDPSEYRVFQLNNGMKVMIILTDSPINIVSLDVSVGSFSDPEDLPGAAHLLEHLLCMATEYHPGKNDYQDQVSRHGGDSNDILLSDHTNYWFAIQNSGFIEVLKHFSEFFKCPLINEDCIATAIDAINQEHQIFSKEVLNIVFHILTQKASRTHPIHKFAIGNSETLSKVGNIKTTQKLFKENYSADKMSLVIVWNKGIEEIMEKVVELFGSIPRGKSEEMILDEKPFSEEELGTITYVRPIGSGKHLMLNWMVTAPYDRLKDHSLYVRILFDSYAKGSLIHQLGNEGLASTVSSSHELYGNISRLAINITMTSKGEVEYKKIIQMTFAYLKFIQSQPIKLDLLKDELEIRKIKFNYNTARTSDTIKEYAKRLNYCPPENIVNLETCFDVENEQEIKEFINLFQPKNVMVIMETDRCFMDKEWLIDEYYKFEYWCETLQLEEIELAFKLPEKNDTIPSEFKIEDQVTDSIEVSPLILVEDSLWFKPILIDEALGIINVLLAKPKFFYSSVKNYSLTTVLINSFRMICKHELYYWYKSGHKVKMNLLEHGIEFQFSGYFHKLGEFAKLVIHKFVDYIISDEHWEIFKDGWRNLPAFMFIIHTLISSFPFHEKFSI